MLISIVPKSSFILLLSFSYVNLGHIISVELSSSSLILFSAVSCPPLSKFISSIFFISNIPLQVFFLWFYSLLKSPVYSHRLSVFSTTSSNFLHYIYYYYLKSDNFNTWPTFAHFSLPFSWMVQLIILPYSSTFCYVIRPSYVFLSYACPLLLFFLISFT